MESSLTFVVSVVTTMWTSRILCTVSVSHFHGTSASYSRCGTYFLNQFYFLCVFRWNRDTLTVDQWDWEKVINLENRNVDYLKETVKKIYKAVYDTHMLVCQKYGMEPCIPEEIHFANTDEMLLKYPNATPKEREEILCKEHGAVFLMGIGGWKSNGELRHDGRAPDYDDWTTPRPDGGKGINGDLLVWNPLLRSSFELSSMGIRVNPEVLLAQLDMCGCPERKDYVWHQMLLNGTLPQTIGGGIGQSRLCQFMLRCAHIGEVQHGWYDPEEVTFLKDHNIRLLGLGEFEEDPMALSLHPGIAKHVLVADAANDSVPATSISA